MNQTVTMENGVSEQLENAIDIGCTMVSRAKKMRKKLGIDREDEASMKKSLKELDRMSVELVDKLIEINVRIGLPNGKNAEKDTKDRNIQSWLGKIMNRFYKKLDKMRFTYQDIYTL
jgi:hypothetical protein